MNKAIQYIKAAYLNLANPLMIITAAYYTTILSAITFKCDKLSSAFVYSLFLLMPLLLFTCYYKKYIVVRRTYYRVFMYAIFHAFIIYCVHNILHRPIEYYESNRVEGLLSYLFVFTPYVAFYKSIMEGKQKKCTKCSVATGLFSEEIIKQEFLYVKYYWTTNTTRRTIGNTTTITHTPVRNSVDIYKFFCICKKCRHQYTYETGINHDFLFMKGIFTKIDNFFKE